MTPEQIKDMIHNEGIYVIGDSNFHRADSMIVVVSRAGRLQPMELENRSLDPNRFYPGAFIKAGPIK